MSAAFAAPARRPFVHRALRRLRRLVAPTVHERSYVRWVRDRGDERLRLRYPLDARSVIVDVGGFDGRWASAAAERFGCTLHAFEPVPEFAVELAQRLAGHPGAHAHVFGLAGSDRLEPFHVAGDGSSALRTGGGPRPLELREADTAFRRLGIDSIDLLKINIEGGEYELLDHLLERGRIAHVRYLQVQFHDFVADAPARMRRLVDRLAATHAPEWRYPFVWESWARRSVEAPR